MKLQHFERINHFSLGLFLIIFLLIGCTTAPRYARQKNPSPNHNHNQPQIKTATDKPKTSIQSQIQLPENSPALDETPPRQNEPAFTQSGIATFYADRFQGKRTAYGEKYNKHDFTAAHLTLPLNTMVKVTSIDNDKFVIVRINDRGPHVANRIIDLSQAAAKEIDLIRKGVTKVKIEVFSNSSATN